MALLMHNWWYNSYKYVENKYAEINNMCLCKINFKDIFSNVHALNNSRDLLAEKLAQIVVTMKNSGLPIVGNWHQMNVWKWIF